MRRAARKDSNHKQIVSDLEAQGVVVFDCSGLAGLGFDILCYQARVVTSDPVLEYVHRVWQPFEIKAPKPTTRAYRSTKRNLRGLEGRMTESELKAAMRAPIPVIESAVEALRYFER
jgi:hypothetical protein